MNLLETINSVFYDNNHEDISGKINEIGDLLEFGEWSKDEIIESVNCLLSHIKDLRDDSDIENILHISLNIMNSHSVYAGFNLEQVISCMNKLNTECISYILTFLGFSGDRNYNVIIQSYFNNDELKEDAEEAFLELNHRIQNTNLGE